MKNNNNKLETNDEHFEYMKDQIMKWLSFLWAYWLIILKVFLFAFGLQILLLFLKGERERAILAIGAIQIAAFRLGILLLNLLKPIMIIFLVYFVVNTLFPKKKHLKNRNNKVTKEQKNKVFRVLNAIERRNKSIFNRKKQKLLRMWVQHDKRINAINYIYYRFFTNRFTNYLINRSKV